MTRVPTRENQLLAQLPARERQRLTNECETERLDFKRELYRPNEPIGHAWFPTGGVVSLVKDLDDGSTIEIATIGNEGFVGLPLILAADSIAHRALIQVPGEGLAVPARRFRQLLERTPGFHRLLLRYAMALMNQMAQSAACNRAHPVDERCARWLLLTHDRVGADQFSLTQEFLAQMLGVRRPTVSAVASMLASRGLISYVRGVITIEDRAGLEAASCACYAAIAQEYQRLLKSRNGERAAAD